MMDQKAQLTDRCCRSYDTVVPEDTTVISTKNKKCGSSFAFQRAHQSSTGQHQTPGTESN